MILGHLLPEAGWRETDRDGGVNDMPHGNVLIAPVHPAGRRCNRLARYTFGGRPACGDVPSAQKDAPDVPLESPRKWPPLPRLRKLQGRRQSQREQTTGP
ncbi:hypothetical protein Pd630_LPD11038 (plasmid) [Rhodococcus opacus PD630]|nr:hypothetical protein Pd630_LPD11038 [Rhodococcus opacus PD630]